MPTEYESQLIHQSVLVPTQQKYAAWSLGPYFKAYVLPVEINSWVLEFLFSLNHRIRSVTVGHQNAIVIMLVDNHGQLSLDQRALIEQDIQNNLLDEQLKNLARFCWTDRLVF